MRLVDLLENGLPLAERRAGEGEAAREDEDRSPRTLRGEIHAGILARPAPTEARRSARLNQTGEQPQHRAEADGLGQVGVESSLEGPAAILGQSVARQRDEEHVAAQRLPKPSRDAVA